MAKEKSEGYEVISVATETEPRIQNNETKEVYTLLESINLILNEIKELRKVVG